MSVKKSVLGMIAVGFLMVAAPVLAASADTNQDGNLSQAEMLAQVDKRFQAADTNRDGKLSQAEWQAHLSAKRQDMQAKKGNRQAAKQTQRVAKQAERQNKRFAMLDSNKDGFISLAESRALAQQSFQKRDTNQDAQISKDERGHKGHKNRKGKMNNK